MRASPLARILLAVYVALAAYASLPPLQGWGAPGPAALPRPRARAGRAVAVHAARPDHAAVRLGRPEGSLRRAPGAAARAAVLRRHRGLHLGSEPACRGACLFRV